MKSQLNWIPKNDTVGVPGKGFIKAEDFSEEDLQALKDRAKRRQIDENVFLIGCNLKPVSPQLEIVEDHPKPTRGKKSVE